MYDALNNLVTAEDSICPEKYEVEGYPPITQFPAVHPNRPNKETISNAKVEL